MRFWSPADFVGSASEVKEIEGVWRLQAPLVSDDRGYFRKPLAGSKALPWISEVFWSLSLPGVVRGMHSAAALAQGDKLVSVISGRVFDALLDLRPGDSLGSRATFELTPDSPSLLIPAGVAHGFQVLDNQPAIVLYVTSNPYAPETDSGVNPLTCGVSWPTTVSSISKRDAALPDLKEVLSHGGWRLAN